MHTAALQLKPERNFGINSEPDHGSTKFFLVFTVGIFYAGIRATNFQAIAPLQCCFKHLFEL